MIERDFTGLPPRITFTSDFHELVRGDLRPGSSVSLRYDPARIVPAVNGYKFGDPAHHIVAHVTFPPHAGAVSIPLHSPSGVLAEPDTDATGGGDMLAATVRIPEDANAMILWFTHEGPYGGTSYDSDFGRNFHFGFPTRQIGLLEATVAEGAPRRPASFTVKVAAAPEVRRVLVRMRVVGTSASPSSEHDLRRSDERRADGWSVWALDPIAVPSRAVVQFKLYYWTNNIRYKDDNSGLYYLALQREPERVPPPPAALAEAARAWR